MRNPTYRYRKFHSSGRLHRNVLLWAIEAKGVTFRDYNLSTTGIQAVNDKAEKVLSKEFGDE